MSNFSFFFNLDATLLKAEIFLEIVKATDKWEEMYKLAEELKKGEVPYKYHLLKKVEILKNIDIIEVNNIIYSISLNDSIEKFIKDNKERCYIVTENLDVWIYKLIHKLGMHDRCFSSKAKIKDNKVLEVEQFVDKGKIASKFSTPFITVGNGNGDAEMMGFSEIGIGFGGISPLTKSILDTADYTVYTEEKLCQFLKRLL